MLMRRTIEADFCVVGGGMAGICAAIAAARGGSKVVLMHERPVLGGNASSEIRMWICGSVHENDRETGILEEIMLENLYRNPTKNYYIWDTVLYDFVLREPNITLLLNCTCMDAQVEKGSYKYGRDIKITKITGYQMTTQTFIDVRARYYADCSGDSILAPLTGANFTLGRESADKYGEDTHVQKADTMTMGMSCLIQGRQTQRTIKFIPPSFSARLKRSHFEHRNPDIYNSSENFWYLELGGDRDTIHDTEEITKELISLATGTWDYIKNSGDYDADNWELEFLGFLPGKRESRRYIGEYMITQRDISDNVTFEDTVAYGGWPLDDHFPAGFYHRGVPNTDIKTPSAYGIPYRCLYSKNVENLFFAGRNISMTHMAMSSIRVMATCALLGQAAGAAADVARKNSLTPHEVYLEKIEDLQDALLDSDCFLPNKTRKVSALCKKTDIVGGDALKDGQDRPHSLYNTKECGIVVDNEAVLEYLFEGEKKIEAVHIVFDSDLERNTLPGDRCEQTHNTRANVLLDSPQMHMPKTLCKEFRLELLKGGKVEHALEASENRKRSYHIEVNKEVDCIRLVPISNWGGFGKTRVFSFDFR
ncbi:MAG: FAD-dependent oxidoreductase [Eubacteriales bacterium]|nr:FAD-dependent oxidoreductase [Eubacteriales bacterium]